VAAKPTVHNISQGVTYISDAESELSEECYYIDCVNEDVHVNVIEYNNEQTQAFAKCKIGPKSTSVRFKIDSGAEVNVLPLRVYEGEMYMIGPLRPPKKQLFAYGGKCLDVKGTVNLECRFGEKSSMPEFHIVDTISVPILGLQTSIDLGLIQLAYTLESACNRDQVLAEYGDVFKGVGLFPGKCTIHVDPKAVPVVHAPRKVPLTIRDKLKAELDKMERDDVIARVTDPTDWVNSLVIVEKANGGLRICLDPRDLNKAIKRPHYPSKTLEDVMHKMHGARFFSKLDARAGYWSIQLDEPSSMLTCFNSPHGRYRFKRLPFGIRSSQDEFQRKIDESFEDLKGVVSIVDDILVFGKSREEHDENLKRVLERARQVGIRFNPEKMEIGTNEVKYFGHVVSAEGLKPDPEKVAAIEEMKPPKDRNELETVLGMITYLAKFAPNLSEITKPMRLLLAKDVEFAWDKPQIDAFQKVKDIITKSPGPVLAFYEPNKDLTLQVDASKYGLGASLLQDGKPVAYASKSLTPCEVNYAQIEKELFAILFGCKRFHQYVYGRRVLVESDHKPLSSIVQKPLSAAPPRLQRMLLQLQKYDIEVVHIPGKDIPVADTLSRKFLPHTYPEMSEGMEVQVHALIDNMPISDKKMIEIKEATEADMQCQVLKQMIEDGWPQLREDCPITAREYWNHRDELVIMNDIIFKGPKIVIPKSLRKCMIEALHVGHMGIEKTTRRARDIIFWPKMSSDINEYVLSCTTCLLHRNANQKEPLTSYPIPDRPWQMIGTDLFTWNNAEYIVVVDYLSNYIEVDKLKSTTSSQVIRSLKSVFSRHGVPETVVSDNGPQYVSDEFRQFEKAWNFNHITSSPHYAQSNGLAEKSVQTIKRLFQKCSESDRDPYLAMLELRTTPLAHGSSPSQILMSRRLRSVLPAKHSQLEPKVVTDLHRKIAELKNKQKRHFDKAAKPLAPLSVGQSVRIKQKKGTWEPALVTECNGNRSYTVDTQNGGSYRRNRRHLFPSNEDNSFPTTDANDVTNNNDLNIMQPPTNETPEACDNSAAEMSADAEYYRTRSGRIIRPPKILSL